MKNFLEKIQKLSPAQLWGGLALFTLLLIALLYWLSTRFNPAPPKTITMSAGAAGGAYENYAKAYAKALAAEGVTLKILPSAGSIQNLQRLTYNKDKPKENGYDEPADIALAQTGVATAKQLETLQGIATVALEPVWVFTSTTLRANFSGQTSPTQLSQLLNIKLAIPKVGSGARATLDNLLRDSGLTIPSIWLEMDTAAAADALDAGSVQGLITVASIQAPIVQRLLKSKHQLMSFSHAEAYSRLNPALVKVVLPRGAIDITADKPAADVTLISSQAALVARDDLHPALVYLLLSAAHTVHAGGSMLHHAGDYPSQNTGEFTKSDETERYFKTGKPFLQRYMPFWLANFVSRLLVILIPLIGILFPLMKLLPELQGMLVQRKLKPWWIQTKQVESDFFTDADINLQSLLNRLEIIDKSVNALHIPAQFIKDAAALQQTLEVARNRIETALSMPPKLL